MDGLLNPVSRTYNKPSENDAPFLQEVKERCFNSNALAHTTSSASSVAEVTEALKNQPDYATLVSVLKLLSRDGKRLGDFHIGAPSPEAARIIHILVTDVAPNYWAVLKEPADNDAIDVGLLLEALQNLAGLKSILLRLHILIQQAEQKSNTTAKRPDILLNVGITLELLGEVLVGDETLYQIWTSTCVGADALKRRILAKDFVQLVGGGRVPSLPAQAETLLTKAATVTTTWTANGVEYSRWLIRNIITLSRRTETNEGTKLAADLLSKAMHLGYFNTVIKMIIADLVNQSAEDGSLFTVFDHLPQSEQRTLLFGIVKELPEFSLNQLDPSDASRQEAAISAAAGLIKKFIEKQPRHTSNLITWLTNSTGAGVGDAVGIRRAVIAALASNKDNIITVFEQHIQQYGDELYIRHTPMLQQEVHAQVLLLSAGYLHRLAPVKLALLLKSGGFNQMVSKRLAASQTRARLLGMIVGEALSALVDKGDKKLDFKMEETKSEDLMWYKRLVSVSDVPGRWDSLVNHQQNDEEWERPSKSPRQPRPALKEVVETSQAKGIIEVVESDDEMEDDIVPLKKPVDDAEDSDDDPETIRRDRPKAPVYIRNLITFLRDTDNYDRQKLALTTAPTLIRRKANFGTEVREHAEELASLLVGLQDKFEIEDFYNLKIEGMTAIVVAQPEKMAPWFAKTFFNGDYSMGQRASVLTALGLGARELAGFAPSAYAASTSFPSQKLPERMQKLYLDGTSPNDQISASPNLKALPSNALDTISKSLTSDWMAPLAANAADAATGPDALKLSSFASRLESQNSSSVSKAKTRIRAIPNTTAQLIATAFFFPLTARFHSALQSITGRTQGIIFQPFLLTLYLKTLALLIHAAGPSTLALPDMTTELVTLLLGSSVRAHCVGDLGVTNAALFALLTVLEVNGDRMRDVCREMGREVVEAQEWVVQVLDSTRGEDAGGEEAAVRALAAGCLVKIQEGIEKYRSLLMGDMIG